jgi:hypothetical protein
MPSLASWRPVPGDAGNLIRGKLASIVREDHWQQVFGAAFGAENQQARRQSSLEVDDTGYIRPYPSHIVGPNSRRIQELEGFFLELERLVRANPRLPENIYREFAAATAKARARGIRVVLVLPPNMEAVNQLFARHSTEMAELEKYVQRLRHDHGVEYLDFSTDAAFSNSPDLFMTEDHLNKFGAALFSRKLSDVLLTAEEQVRFRAQWNRSQVGVREVPEQGNRDAAERGKGRGGRRAGRGTNAGGPAASLPIEGWEIATREGNGATLVSQRAENWMRVTIDKLASRSPASIRLRTGPISVTRNHRYVLTFFLQADAARPVTCGLASGTSPDTLLGASTRVDAGTWWQEFSCAFRATATDVNARIFFDLGTSQAALELSRVELRDLSTGTVVMSTDPAWKPPAPKGR